MPVKSKKPKNIYLRKKLLEQCPESISVGFVNHYGMVSLRWMLMKTTYSNKREDRRGKYASVPKDLISLVKLSAGMKMR